MTSFFKKETPWALSWGLLFCFSQIFICLVLAPKSDSFQSLYLKLNQWDSAHYAQIAEQGYHLPPGVLTAQDIHSGRANVTFFPGFPLASRITQVVFGVSTPLALLITAQCFCLLFWTQFFLLLRYWKKSRQLVLKTGLRVALYPGSFFMVVGYSESLFLASLMGLIYGTERWMDSHPKGKVNLNWLLASFSGFCLSMTRLVGMPLFIYPIIRSFSFSLKLKPKIYKKIQLGALFLSFFTALGGALFLIHCQLKFKQWDLYFKLGKIGWGNEPHYLSLLNPLSYLPRLFFEDTTISVCKISSLFILILFFFCYRVELIEKRGIKFRLGIYISAFFLFFIPLAGKIAHQLEGMVRYNLPVFILLVLAVSNLGPLSETFFLKKWMTHRGLRTAGLILSLVTQIWMILVFTRGGWVA